MNCTEYSEEELMSAAFERNIVVLDKYAKLGEFTPRLIQILNKVIGPYGFTDILHKEEFIDLYNKHQGYWPAEYSGIYADEDEKNICVAVNLPLIRAEGLKKEYVLMGMY